MISPAMQVVLKQLASLNPRALLQAEVPSTQQKDFEARYLKATGITVSPVASDHYQDQPNKWGAELRVYFNGSDVADSLKALGVHIEGPRSGYMSNQYSFRFNDNALWWALVEQHGLGLGPN